MGSQYPARTIRSAAKSIKQLISISNNGAHRRFWSTLFHEGGDEERGFYNCWDPCKTQRNWEPKRAQIKTPLLQSQHVLPCLGWESTWQQEVERTEHFVPHPDLAKGRTEVVLNKGSQGLPSTSPSDGESVWREWHTWWLLEFTALSNDSMTSHFHEICFVI